MTAAQAGTTTDVTVVIPYFQTQAGILRRALASVAAQSPALAIELLVIDDSSPVPPGPEVAAVQWPSHVRVEVLRQANAGPAAARNRGLDHAAVGGRFFAFLDSDDAWEPTHLADALAALGDDLDFYCANYTEPGSDVGEFDRNGRLQLDQHEPLARAPGAYRFRGDFVDQIVRANVVETSTVVFRRATLGALRFRPEFVNAFEDHLFWLAAAQTSRGIAFGSRVACRYGTGVNIWRGSGVGSARIQGALLGQCRYLAELRRVLPLTEAQRAAVDTKVAGYRRTFVADLLHRLRRGQLPPWRSTLRMFAADPVLAWKAPGIAVGLAVARGRQSAAAGEAR